MIKRVDFIVINELGNTIPMSVIKDERGVTVTASGPHSEVEHTWTPIEAMTLRDMLNTIFEDDPDAKSIYDQH